MPDDPKPIKATTETLAKTLRRRPVLWVGAGTSIAAGHPSTDALVAAMIDDADDPIDPKLSFEQVADAYVASVGEGALEDLLQCELGGSPPLTELHRALARQAGEGTFAAIVTTNYDDLLERALGEAEVRYVPQKLEDNSVVVDQQAAVRLLKLHGSRDDWQNAVLSGKAYASFGRRYPFLVKQLDVLLRSHPVLFVGCSLQDPRILDWLAGLKEAEAQNLKPWRPLMLQKEWDEALAASDALRRGNIRPLILEDHDELNRLWTEVAPPKRESAAPEPARLELRLTVTSSAVNVRLDGEAWEVEDLFADEALVAGIDQLRELGTQALPTDEHGALAPAARGTHAALRELAAKVGERLTTALLPDEALETVRAAVRAGSAGRPALLCLGVAADGSDARLADRWLALPWELLRVDDRFPVEDHSLDLVREAVVEELPGLPTPKPLGIVATVAAPVDAVELDYEGEMYRLWRALGSGDEKRLAVTDLGTLDDLARAVKTHKPPVVHFTGHGRPGELIFEDEAALKRPVGVEALVRELRDAGPLPPMIYLSACHGTTVGLASDGSPSTDGTANRETGGNERMVEMAAVEATAPSTAASLHRGGFTQVVAYFGPVGDAQATRTAAAFYAALAGGDTARAALRRARGRATEPLEVSDGRLVAIYPLGWAQLALYHRGPDRSTALPAPPSQALAPRADAPLERIHRRLDKEGGTTRVEGIEGVQQLRFGFIGRRQPRGEAVRRWRDGDRVLVVEGLGGLGKTALCAELLRILAEGCRVLALDGRWAGAQPEPLAALWQEVQAARSDEDWSAALAALQRDGITGAALAEAVRLLAAREGGLIVYLDDAESLQVEPEEGAGLGRWRSDELRSFWAALVASAVDHGPLGLIASSRYRPEGTPDGTVLPLSPMSRWEIVRLMRWTKTLHRLPQKDLAWLADKVDGHPRTVEYLEVLARKAEKNLTPTGGRFAGNWREEIVEPILEQVGDRLEADLLLPQVWQALGDKTREHLGRCTVLSAPAPWEVVRELEDTEGTGRALVDAGLLSPFQVAGDAWWAPHRLVSEMVGNLWEGDVTDAHRRVGLWFQAKHGENREMALAQRAVEHLCAAGDGDEAWPTAEALVLSLRGAGRFREALGWVQRVLGAQPTGAKLGIALTYEVHLRRRSGLRLAEGRAKLSEALTKVEETQRSIVLYELGLYSQAQGHLSEAARSLEKAFEAASESFGEESEESSTCLHALAGVLKAQGNLPAAREKLERALQIWAVFGTEEHPSVAASMHELARVLQAQGDLPAAREKLERALQIQAAVFGTEEHPSVTASMHELAGVLQAQGDLPAAREKLERVLEIEPAIFGTEEHPSVAESMHSLGGVLQAQGDLPAAREKLERALQIKAAVFGTEEHPEVAASMHSLAGVLQAQGDLPAAREKLETVLQIWAAVFGTEEHPSVAASMHELARVLQAQGDLQAAREKLEQVLEIEEKIYGTREHYSTAITEMTLGSLLLELDDAKAGVALLAHAYAVLLKQLGPDHPYTQQLAPLFESSVEPTGEG